MTDLRLRARSVPSGLTFVAPDVLRLVAVLGLVAATVTDGFVGLALMLLVLGGCMVPRAAAMPHSFDVLFCTFLVAAAWAALLDLYERIAWLDLAVHALVTGLVGAAAAFLVQRADVLSPVLGPVAVATVLALASATTAVALAALWEVGEWLGHTFVDERIQVGYTDTVSDLLAGTVGAVVAATLVAVSRLREAR